MNKEAMSRGDILAATSRTHCEWVEIEELERSVYVRVMTGTESDNLLSSVIDPKTGKSSMKMIEGYRARQVAVFLSDEKGARLFADSDVEQLGSLLAPALQAIVDAGRKLNGMDDDDVDGLEKNSETTQSEEDGSD